MPAPALNNTRHARLRALAGEVLGPHPSPPEVRAHVMGLIGAQEQAPAQCGQRGRFLLQVTGRRWADLTAMTVLGEQLLGARGVVWAPHAVAARRPCGCLRASTPAGAQLTLACAEHWLPV
jgi:hypothetical protein